MTFDDDRPLATSDDDASVAGASPASTRTSRFVAASAEEIYAAFTDPEILIEWLPPPGMIGRFHSFDTRVGGGYEMSLYYRDDVEGVAGKSGEREDRVIARFVELRPHDRIVESIRFVSDDPAFGGEMSHTITLEKVDGGTNVTLAFDNLPSGLRPEDNDEGARQSLEQLARRFEAGRKDDPG